MTKRTDHINAWFINLSADASHVRRITSILQSRQIAIESWHPGSEPEIGLILVGGMDQYENLISLLNIQLKQKGNRIIVLNTATQAFPQSAIMKIFSFGAEYYFESACCGAEFDCIAEKLTRWRAIEVILRSPMVRNTVTGDCKAFKQLLREVIEVSLYSDSSLLILGERGTGKELIAKLIHEIDKRRARSGLVLIDCTTIRPELSGSEFFGHEKGSYTGADHTREGAFALANEGTLFLDEVGELPLSMQAELLRVIQEGTYKKLGSNTWRQTDFRLVCATNRNLEKEADSGHFRKDLYDRISLWKCRIPSLHERREDIPSLINFFLRKKFTDQLPVIDDAVMQYLTQRDYEGNVRELQNLVSRIMLRYVGSGPITLGDIPEYDRQLHVPTKNNWYENSSLSEIITEALQTGHDVKNIMDTIKSVITRTALSFTGSNKEVSQLLGKSERWIQLQKAKEK